MATANNTIETRIQLKNDTESNWLSHPLVPLAGEIIIYNPDNNYAYTRLKIGDGHSSTTNLPFIDAGTLNGTEVELVKKANKDAFPQNGSSDKLYVDLSTNAIYHYDLNNEYTQLSNFTYDVERTTVSAITRWRGGNMTEASISNHVLSIRNGLAPDLLYEDRTVVRTMTKGGNE